MLEQAKFTFSLSVKAFEKQIKTIEDQGQKQVKSLEDLKDNEKKQIHTDDYKNKLLISKERETFKNIYSKRLDKIEELTKKIDNNDLNFIVNSTGDETDFSEVEDPITLLDNIKSDEITIEKAKDLQEGFNKQLKTIQRGNKTEERKKKFTNVNMLFNGRNGAIEFIEGYSPMILEAKKRLQKNQQQMKDLKY